MGLVDFLQQEPSGGGIGIPRGTPSRTPRHPQYIPFRITIIRITNDELRNGHNGGIICVCVCVCVGIMVGWLGKGKMSLCSCLGLDVGRGQRTVTFGGNWQLRLPHLRCPPVLSLHSFDSSPPHSTLIISSQFHLLPLTPISLSLYYYSSIL